MSLHPLTKQGIEENWEPGDGKFYCGCMKFAEWTLCQYHQGYEDAAQAMQERLDEADVAVRLYSGRLEGWNLTDEQKAAVSRTLARIDGGEQSNE